MDIKKLIHAIKHYYYQDDKPATETEAAVDAFHTLYYTNGERTWNNTYWFGVPTLKCPLDMWVYQEILHELRPDVIIETGTSSGGSALFMAHICDHLGKGRIITVDLLDKPGRPEHERITYVLGSSTSDEAVGKVKAELSDDQTVLVILDSNHSKKHVLDELKIYSEFVSTGSYLIVEDSNVGGHPVSLDFGEGPMEAMEAFLAGRDDYEVDESREKYYLTFNPRGYLRKLK